MIYLWASFDIQFKVFLKNICISINWKYKHLDYPIITQIKEYIFIDRINVKNYNENILVKNNNEKQPKRSLDFTSDLSKNISI